MALAPPFRSGRGMNGAHTDGQSGERSRWEDSPVSQTYIRPEILYGWHGQSQLIVNQRGDCGDDQTLSGFYFREARHLRTLRLTVDGKSPWLSQAAVESPTALRFDYVHPEMEAFGGGGSGQSDDQVQTDNDGIPYRALDLRLRYEIGTAGLRVLLEVTNRCRQTVSFDVGWTVDADFADIQEALGARRQQEAAVARDADGCLLRFRYEHPELPYQTSLTTGGAGTRHVRPDGLATRLTLATQQAATLTLVVEALDYRDPLDAADVAEREHAWRKWRDGLTRVATPGNAIAEATLAQNLDDLASFSLLQGKRDEWLALQAGMPVYPALFGRDTITAGWQAAMADRGQVLDASLTRLGRLQSDRDDAWRDEQPGRIPYQVRQGPLARLDINPYSAYYADFASPLMFVIALAHVYSWTGEKECLVRHWDTARRILDWAREYGDRDGDGYLEYLTRSSDGTKNQGWKDSGDAIVHEDGTPVAAPLGTCELQGYWYAAQQLFAVMSWVMDARDDAKGYWQSAMDLKARFNRDWWVEADHCPALAMDAEKRVVRAVASNAAHCLAAGIVSDDHLPSLVGRLFAPDMFSGWGIRTLSSAHASYNPVSYHLGSVWAVENATAVFGLRRFGFDVRAVELTRALFDLAALYPDHRIPECVGGYARGERMSPGAYPRANTPQLWNASSFSLLVHSLLGLQPVAPLDLLVIDPVLPTWLPEVILHDLRLGGAAATIRFWRGGDGDSHAEVLHQRGTLHLLKQPPLESLASGARDRLGAFVDGLWHR
jgi:glycogen debranching enzyme